MVFRSFFLCAVQYMSFRQSLFRAKLKVKLYSPRVPIFLCAQRSFINSFECRFESLCSHWFEVFSEGAFIFSNPCFIISNKEDFRKTQNLPSKIFTFFFPLKEDKSGRTVVWPPKIQITYLAECRQLYTHKLNFHFMQWKLSQPYLLHNIKGQSSTVPHLCSFLFPLIIVCILAGLN